MKQTIDVMRMRHFPLLIISMGAVLVVMSLIGIATVFTSATRPNVLRFVFYFILPFMGGALLLLSGMTLMDIGSSSLHRSYAANGRKMVEKERSKMLSVMLNGDERKVLDLIKASPNGALQSELVIKSGFSKVKTHRMLKKLEQKELITRGRFGITNKVFLN
jgi:uncharacterized membrane protein